MAWCPSRENKSLIAAASKEGAGGGFDDVGGSLEIYELDLSSSTEDMLLRGAAKTPLKFETLAWAQFTAGGVHPAGILAGGMTDGSVTIWDPATLLNGSSQQPLTSVVGKHRSNVCALAFNPAANMSHILASGSSDNTVLLFDLNNPGSGEIAHYAPAEGEVTGHSAAVRSVAWNNEVGHILATAASDGVTSVWDLRAKRPWCHLRDPSGAPCSAISWNPNTGSGNVFLMTASDDDTKPVMRLWDLRKSTTTPMMELGGAHVGGHTRGIVSLNWCPYDEAIIVSSAKDKRTLFWDLYTCQVVEELDTTQGGGAMTGGGVVGAGGGVGTGAAGVAAASIGGASPLGVQQGGFGQQQSPFGGGPSTFGAGAQSSFGGGMGGMGVGAAGKTDSGVRDIVWSPSMPGVLACSTLGREMQVHGITAFKGNPQRAPKWLQVSLYF
jgi:protein transport protein SEC31